MIPNKKKALREFVLVALMLIISVVVSICSIEAYLRYAFHVSDLITGYYPLGNSVAGAKIKMVQREYSINLDFNNQGFRDREFSFERGVERRVLFLGDSFVEGTGVSVGKRASSLIEKLLQQNDDGNFRVFNAGQLATNPISYFENFAQFGVSLKPELVVVGVFMGNDFQNSRASPVPKNYSIADTHTPRTVGGIPDFFHLGYLRAFILGICSGKQQLVKSEVTDKFWDYYFKEKVNKDFFIKKSGISLARFEAFENLLSKDVARDFYNAKLNPSYFLGAIDSLEGHSVQLYDADDLNNVVDIIRVMNDECMRREVRLMVVTYPDIFQVASELYSRHLVDTLHMSKIPESMLQLKDLRLKFLNELEINRIAYTDLTPALSANDYYLFDGHLNESGQAIAAQLIYRRLKERMADGAQPLGNNAVHR